MVTPCDRAVICASLRVTLLALPTLAGEHHGMPSLRDSTPGRTLRSLRRSPAFMLIATLSLGAALGLSTAVFAFIDSMTHPVSPITEVDRLFEVRLFQQSRAMMSESRQRFQEAIASTEGVAQMSTAQWTWDYVETGTAIDRLFVTTVRPGFFEMLRTAPRLGRLPRPDETGAGIAVVSDKLWRSKYADRREIGGATLKYADRTYAIIGVMPYRGEFPNNTSVWIQDETPNRGGFGTSFIRLAPGADRHAVERQIDASLGRLTPQLLPGNARPIDAALMGVRANPLDLKDYHYAMIGAALCVLLIACANVAALMLARGNVRTRDYALRLALGARRRDIATEVLAEVGVVTVGGIVVGVFVTMWTVAFLTGGIPAELDWLGLTQPQWSLRVFAQVAACVVLTVAIAGGYPAWRASRIAPATPLKENSGGTTSRAGTRFRWLVIGELAVTMMLLMVTSLMVKSAMTMAADREERAPRETFTLQMGLRERGTNFAQMQSDLAAVAQRIRQVPGVTGVAATSECAVQSNVITSDRWTEGAPTFTFPQCSNVGADYLIPEGWRFLDGRDFTEADRAGTGALILDSLSAAHLFRGERAVGRMIKLGPLRSHKPWLPVVGVVATRGDLSVLAPDSTRAKLFAAMPLDGRMVFFSVSATPDVPGVGLALGRIGQEASAAMRAYAFVSSSNARWAQSYKVQEFLSIIFSLLGGTSLALGAAGMFSVLSYIASQRMREFAIRIALGSTEPGVLRIVLRDGLIMGLGGTAFGAFLGMRAGFLIWERMYGDLYPVDVGALLAAEAVLIGVALLASLVPARRAMRANPVEVMRAI